MTQTFNENVVVDGVADVAQLTVQGHSSQSNPLQIWEDSAGTDLARLTGDGRWQQGNMSMTTNESLLEAHQEGTSSSAVKRGLNSKGRFTGAVTDAISWLMAELELAGVGTITGIHRAIRAKLSHNNATGNSVNADLRAGDFEASNQSGTSGSPVGQMTGVQGKIDNQANAYLSNARAVAGQVSNASGATITKAAALEVLPPVNSGSIATLIGLEIPDISQGTDNYAIRTGAGKVKLGALGNGLLKSTAGLLGIAVKGTDYEQPMVGATGTVAGQPGVVPQPAATDNNKFLRGDGTWSEAGTVSALNDLSDVDTTGVATNDVLTFTGSGWEPQAVVVPSGIPSGVFMPYAGSSAPTGWLLCNGAAVSRSTYADLFAAIGSGYGSGDGSTTFNLPDMRGRVVVGAGQGSGLTNRSLGSSFGEENHQLTVSEMPNHTHDNTVHEQASTTFASNQYATLYAREQQTNRSGSEYIVATGGDAAHNNMQPSLVANYIIKA